jgi:hypothetical protein
LVSLTLFFLLSVLGFELRASMLGRQMLLVSLSLNVLPPADTEKSGDAGEGNSRYACYFFSQFGSGETETNEQVIYSKDITKRGR